MKLEKMVNSQILKEKYWLITDIKKMLRNLSKIYTTIIIVTIQLKCIKEKIFCIKC